MTPEAIRRRRIYRLAGFGALIVAVVAVALAPVRHPWLINHSPSMPVGIYTLSSLDRPVLRGDTIVICAPHAIALLAVRRGYFEAGSCYANTEPLVKLVAAVAGDEVDLRSDSIAVDGKCLGASRTFATDSRGARLPAIARGRYRVAPNHVWVWGVAPRSFDSRYYGALDLADAQFLAAPLLVRPAPATLAFSNGPCSRTATSAPSQSP